MKTDFTIIFSRSKHFSSLNKPFSWEKCFPLSNSCRYLFIEIDKYSSSFENPPKDHSIIFLIRKIDDKRFETLCLKTGLRNHSKKFLFRLNWYYNDVSEFKLRWKLNFIVEDYHDMVFLLTWFPAIADILVRKIVWHFLKHRLVWKQKQWMQSLLIISSNLTSIEFFPFLLDIPKV